MKTSFSLVLLLFLSMSLFARAATTVFMIGVDDNPNSTNEFEQEGGGRTDQRYYWENGNYTGLIGKTGVAGLNWTLGQEPFRDDSSDLGFSRAVTSSFQSQDIFFQLTPEMVGVGKSLILEIEYFSVSQSAGNPESVHNLDYFLNNVKVGSVAGISAANTPQIVSITIDASTFSAGPSVLSWVRTGGVPGWANMDYVKLTAVPEPSKMLLMSLGLILLNFKRKR